MMRPLRPVPVCFNGRFLTQPASGVQRFALELLLALDCQLDAPDRAGQHRFELLIPNGVRELPTFKHIAIRRVAGRGNHWWDQMLRRHCPAEAVMVNLANGGCILRRRHLSVLHDASVYLMPGNFTWRYRLWHRSLGRLLALCSTIATVSTTSRDDLCRVIGLRAGEVSVIPNASEHLEAVTPDPAVLPRLGLEAGRYFVIIGSAAPNKNVQRAVEAFSQVEAAGERLVIVGGVDAAVFGRTPVSQRQGVLLPGRLPDAEIAALLRQARALVFPSLYEGFGIPPLEAMSCACPVLASDIPAVREVCGQAALLFDPLDPTSIAAAMRRAVTDPTHMEVLRQRGLAQVRRFSWRHSASLLLHLLDTMTTPRNSAALPRETEVSP